MTRTPARWLLLLASVAVVLAGCSSADSTPTRPAVTSLPSDATATDLADASTCYVATVGDATAYLVLRSLAAQVGSGVAAARFVGSLEYDFGQKDDSWGNVNASRQGDRLVVEYQYFSEGVLSTRNLELVATSDGGWTGDGFTYEPAATCGLGEGWVAADVSETTVGSFHDPETGYYARAQFRLGSSDGTYSYRCIADVRDAGGAIVQRWATIGVSDASLRTKTLSMQTNIRPDQLESLEAVTVECSTRADVK